MKYSAISEPDKLKKVEVGGEEPSPAMAAVLVRIGPSMVTVQAATVVPAREQSMNWLLKCVNVVEILDVGSHADP